LITCYKCGQIIREIGELSEVHSLGLALMGKCPGCGTRINCQELWKKTKYIDKTRPRATRKNQEKQTKKGYVITPKDSKNSLETVLESQF
jgi:hypothetical protein